MAEGIFNQKIIALSYQYCVYLRLLRKGTLTLAPQPQSCITFYLQLPALIDRFVLRFWLLEMVIAVIDRIQLI